MTTTDFEPLDPPAPEEYLPEPVYGEAQDVEGWLDGIDVDAQFEGLVAGFIRTLDDRQRQRSSTGLRTWQQNLDWANGQITHPDRWWEGLCQMFCRTAVGAGGGNASAWIQWLNTSPSRKHPGGNVNDAPIGAMLFSKGESKFGHVWIAARPFQDGTPGSISTDIKRVGFPDRCTRKGLLDAWGHDYLGWTTEMNNVPVDVKEPKPADTLHYQALGAARDHYRQALDDLRVARETASDQKDWDDRKKIQAEIDLCKKRIGRADALYDRLRRS